ncbi:hypothetical protein EMCRGX_G005158 [Ephydatia muelleri]
MYTRRPPSRLMLPLNDHKDSYWYIFYSLNSQAVGSFGVVLSNSARCCSNIAHTHITITPSSHYFVFLTFSLNCHLVIPYLIYFSPCPFSYHPSFPHTSSLLNLGIIAVISLLPWQHDQL